MSPTGTACATTTPTCGSNSAGPTPPEPRRGRTFAAGRAADSVQVIASVEVIAPAPAIAAYAIAVVLAATQAAAGAIVPAPGRPAARPVAGPGVTPPFPAGVVLPARMPLAAARVLGAWVAQAGLPAAAAASAAVAVASAAVAAASGEAAAVFAAAADGGPILP